jgi:hypothetical protein
MHRDPPDALIMLTVLYKALAQASRLAPSDATTAPILASVACTRADFLAVCSRVVAEGIAPPIDSPQFVAPAPAWPSQTKPSAKRRRTRAHGAHPTASARVVE